MLQAWNVNFALIDWLVNTPMRDVNVTHTVDAENPVSLEAWKIRPLFHVYLTSWSSMHTLMLIYDL